VSELLATLLLGASLRLDLPEEAPTLGGVEIDVRYAVVPDAFVGLALGWGGGVNDTNPDRLLISQRIEALALLGGRMPLTDTFALGATARAGIARLERWPRGALTSTQQFSPSVGGELTALASLTPTVALEPRLGLGFVRVKDDWRSVPGVALGLLFTLDGP
jgi:hypothetical protein